MVEGDCRMGSNLTTVATEMSISFSLMYSAGMVAVCVCACMRVCVCVLAEGIHIQTPIPGK